MTKQFRALFETDWGHPCVKYIDAPDIYLATKAAELWEEQSGNVKLALIEEI